MIAQQQANGLLGFFEILIFGRVVGVLFQADIALMTIFLGGFTKVSQ